MLKVVAALVIMLLMVGGLAFAEMETSSYTEKFAEVSGRAMTNIVTAPCEVAIQTAKDPFLGVFKGFGMWVARSVHGALDLATVWIPKYKNPAPEPETILE